MNIYLILICGKVTHEQSSTYLIRLQYKVDGTWTYNIRSATVSYIPLLSYILKILEIYPILSYFAVFILYFTILMLCIYFFVHSLLESLWKSALLISQHVIMNI